MNHFFQILTEMSMLIQDGPLRDQCGVLIMLSKVEILKILDFIFVLALITKPVMVLHST